MAFSFVKHCAIAWMWPRLFCAGGYSALAADGDPSAAAMDNPEAWSFFILNDNCPDYTWGWDETATRKAFADIVAAHLDVMKETDSQPPQSRNRYNMAVAQEALCFVERYPERKEELIRRIREGRIYVSPFLCNTLWALNSIEQALRALYPARRLAEEWGFPLDTAHHIEEPSLPWGMATLLAGSGIRWLNVPFLKYDSTFATLENPPLFAYEGPDGSAVRVVMDPWASLRASYAQGRNILKAPDSVMADWLPHYRSLGSGYPWRAILASGTHGDISPTKGEQAAGFAQAIIDYNAQPGVHPALINATFPMFCQAVDAAIEAGADLSAVRGCFGHSWDLWPVSLAKYVADMRQSESEYLAAEALLAAGQRYRPSLGAETRAERERAEWLWAMLADHAWNGTTIENKRHNAELRKAWAAELSEIAARLRNRAWQAAGESALPSGIAVFNPLSFERGDLVRWETERIPHSARLNDKTLKCQAVEEDGARVAYFAASGVPGFGLARVGIETDSSSEGGVASSIFRASDSEIDGPFYSLKVDPDSGRIVNLVHKLSGLEWTDREDGIGICGLLYNDGADHVLENATCSLAADGPVLARLSIRGQIPAARAAATVYVTVYADIDRIDFDCRIVKEPGESQERLCHVFPSWNEKALLRIETPAAVIRPLVQPEGDLLPWADTKRFAVQGFVDASLPEGPGVSICPLDSFLLIRNSAGGDIVFEALGNDQNYKEVTRDQNGEREFRFRYSVRVHAGPYDQAQALAFSRAARTPLTVLPGAPAAEFAPPSLAVPAGRAIATCWKPADDAANGASVLRLWETAGSADPVAISAPGVRQAFACDLLERVKEEIPVTDEGFAVNIRPYGFACVRLIAGEI